MTTYWEWIEQRKHKYKTLHGYDEPVLANPDQLEYKENAINPKAERLKEWLDKGGMQDFSLRQRQVFELAFLKGMKERTIAKLLGITHQRVNNIKEQVKRRISFAINLQY